MTFRVFARQPTGAIELLGTFETKLDAERAVTLPGSHIVDEDNELVMTHRRTDARVERVIQVALEKRRHPAFGNDAKLAPVQRLPTQPTRGRVPEQVEVNGVTRTRDEWAKHFDVDVSAIYQSARLRNLSFAEEIARRLSLQAIKDSAARARAERSKSAETIEPVAPVLEEVPCEREDWGSEFVRVVEESHVADPPARVVEEPASGTAQEPEQRHEPTHPAIAPLAPTDSATWFTAREVRILSAVLEHGGVEQLLNDATLGKHVRELAQAGKR